MVERATGLCGKYFVEYESGQVVRHGAVVQDLGSGLFVLEFMVDLGDRQESVLEVEHVVKMKNRLFYRDAEAAEHHFAALALESMPDIDLQEFVPQCAADYEDLVSDQIIDEWSRGRVDRVRDLEELLKSMGKHGSQAEVARILGGDQKRSERPSP